MDHRVVDVIFRLEGRVYLPATYSYPLYAALARELPWLHESDKVGIFPLNGNYAEGQVRLGPRSSLRIRLPAEDLSRIIELTGRRLKLGVGDLRVGIPRILPLRPAATLYSRFVQIKLATPSGRVTPEAFLMSAQKQLVELGIQGRVGIPVWREGPRAGEPKRRVLHIKGERHVGFALLVEGLTAEESLRLQEHGLGGRRKMGCGLFLPVRW